MTRIEFACQFPHSSRYWLSRGPAIRTAGFAFIFGNSIKNLFEAVLYLFVQHPFDVGDILILDSGVGDRVKAHPRFQNHRFLTMQPSQAPEVQVEIVAPIQVEEISLSTIVVRRGDGVRMWVPTTQLVPKTCQNISRSDNRSEAFKVSPG